jgi:hypothetical protein
MNRKSSFYPDDLLDRVIEVGGGLPDDDREVEVLADIDVDGQRLYERAPRRDALRTCLEGAAEQHMRSLRDGAAPTRAMVVRRYAEIESALKRCIKVIGRSGKAGSKPDRIGWIVHSELGLELAGGQPSLEAVSGWRVQKTTEDLEHLLRCATRLREKSENTEPSAPSETQSGDVPLDELIRWLGHAWFVVFERLPGASVNNEDGAVGGPFIRFVRAALEPLMRDIPTDKALRARVRRVLPSLRSQVNMAKSEKK